MKKERTGKRISARTLVLVWALAAVMVIGGTAGVTLAWLTAKSQTVNNVFTAGNVGVTLTETKKYFKMIPGWTIEKDPVVTVTAGSEDCWVFLEVEETGVKYTEDDTEKTYAFREYIDYVIDSSWTALKDLDEDGYADDGVYYKAVKDVADNEATKINVLGYKKADGTFEKEKVLVNSSVTKAMMDAVTTNNQPKLTFTAYAIQMMKSNNTEFKPADAWDAINNTSGSGQ